MTIIRNTQQADTWLRKRIGSRTIKAEDGVAISVDGHCVGIAARTYLGHGAGYDFARDIVYACHAQRAIKKTAVPWGGLRLWLGGPGHIAYTTKKTSNVICNVGNVLKEQDASYWGGMAYQGWVWPWDIPMWGKQPSSGIAVPTPAQVKQAHILHLLHLLHLGTITPAQRAELHQLTGK